MTENNTANSAYASAKRKKAKPRGDPSKLVPFKKGKGVDRDPRINVKGPNVNNLATLRQVILDVLNEQGIENPDETLLHDLVRMMLTSSNALDHKTLLEYAVGKLAQPVQLQADVNMSIEKTVGIDTDEL